MSEASLLYRRMVQFPGQVSVTSGSVEAEDTSGGVDFKTVAFVIQGHTAAHVHVVGDDDRVGDYELNLQSGDLWPAS